MSLCVFCGRDKIGQVCNDCKGAVTLTADEARRLRECLAKTKDLAERVVIMRSYPIPAGPSEHTTKMAKELLDAVSDIKLGEI
jgi:hypothetical protein